MMNTKNKKIRILSIDGGGIRGIIPAVIVAELEKHIGQITGEKENARIADYVDFFAGTSTGGILTCFYTAPSTSQFPAKDAIDLYESEGKTIFKKHPYSKVLHWLYNEIYSAKGLEKLLKEYFRKDKLSETKKPILITAYDIIQRKAVIFNTWKAKDLDHRNYLIRDIARATSAAPTYFEVAKIQSSTDIESTLIDGGVFANDPTLCAYVEAPKFLEIEKESPLKIDDMYMVSIGTGRADQVKRYEYDKVKDWGVVKWAAPVIDIMMSASAEVVKYQMEKIVETMKPKDQINQTYIKLEPELCNASEQMDNVKEKNIRRLKNAALNYVKDNSEILRKIAHNLVEFGKND